MSETTATDVPAHGVLRDAMGRAGIALVQREEELGVGDSPFPDDIAQAAVIAFLRALGMDALADAAKEAGREIL